MPDNKIYLPEYAQDGLLFWAALMAITYIWSQRDQVFHASVLYQNLCVLTAVSFSFVIFTPFIDLLTGCSISRYQAQTDRFFVFMFNIALIVAIYFIGAKYFGFNDIVAFN